MGKDGFEQLRVLVVDDNRHMRSLLRALLLSIGVRQVFDASDGEQGLAVLAAEDPQLVITDYSMKPMNGSEFTRAVRKREGLPGMVPIVMVSGHSERRYVEDARDAGVNEFLCKPVTIRDLETRLTNIFEHPRPFVRTRGYIGPDRRRRHAGYTGPERRRSMAYI